MTPAFWAELPQIVGRTRANLRLMALRLQESFTCLERARVPVLAAIQGGCTAAPSTW